jgi:putative restriction endonuclease
VERDDELRAACFLALDALRAQFGDDLPYAEVLSRRFAFDGREIPFLTRMRGIYRSREQRGQAALSVNTSYESPYNDEITVDGFLYAFQAGSLDNVDNRWLVAAHELQVPLVYFWGGFRPGWYRPIYPCYVERVFPEERRVLLTPGNGLGVTAKPLTDLIERRYIVRETKVRLHQDRFRGAVLLAYRDQCAICRLKEIRLLDAAHIEPDTHLMGLPSISNGLSMCTIHHRAFDRNLVGISPEYEVRVSKRLLDDEDGPMLEVLKGFHGQPMHLPSRKAQYPDRERLAARFERFE